MLLSISEELGLECFFWITVPVGFTLFLSVTWSPLISGWFSYLFITKLQVLLLDLTCESEKISEAELEAKELSAMSNGKKRKKNLALIVPPAMLGLFTYFISFTPKSSRSRKATKKEKLMSTLFFFILVSPFLHGKRHSDLLPWALTNI